MLKKIIPILVILSLVLPSFVQVAQAGVLDSTVGFSSCAAAGFISHLVSKGLSDLQNWISTKIKSWLVSKKLIPIPSAPISFGLGSSVPVTTIRGSVNDSVESFKGIYSSKEGAQDIIARCSAREILTAMGRNITNVARTGGRDGGPAWVRNWRNFRLESQYRGEGIFKAMLASTNTCGYFANDLKDLFGANRKIALTRIKTRTYDVDSYQTRAGCTLPSDFDYNDYKRDFSGNGGWEAWSRLMKPQNNFYGSLFQAQDEMNRQRALEEQASVDEAGPTGFTAVRGRNAADSCAVRSPEEGRCLVYKDILTPSGILSGAVVAGFEAELQWVATTDELSELIATGINVLLNRLWNLSDPNEGDYIVPGDEDVTIPPFPEPPGGGGGTCPVSTEPPSVCQSVDQSTVLAILNNYLPTNEGITEAIEEVKTIYPSASVIPHPERLDKIDFGGGLIVDVIIGSGEPGSSWGWIVECQCGGDINIPEIPIPPIPLP